MSFSPATTSAQVSARQNWIANASDAGNGIFEFNWIYRVSRENVLAAANQGFFKDPAYIGLLDVRFGNRWLTAAEAMIAGIVAEIPLAWRAFYANNLNSHVLPVQHMLAGLVVHILRDLTLANFEIEKGKDVLGNKTFGLVPGLPSPHWSDYSKVNEVLLQTMRQDVLPVVRDSYPTILHQIDALLAGFSIVGARLDAWDRGNTMRLTYDTIANALLPLTTPSQRKAKAQAAVDVQDRAYSIEAAGLAGTFYVPPLKDLL